MQKNRKQLVVLAVLLGAFGFLTVRHQAVLDWLRLRGYTPSAAVSTIASQDTMTSHAQHLFYVNRPQITASSNFSNHCPSGSEKTVVLGCYVGNDRGIYIYDVTDNRLDGIEQVTAAHEMLHAAYRRLSTSQRKTVDAMLMDYYTNQLSDQRIKDTIDAYKQSEPNDVVNEMHSIFGTEVAQLPAPLESYYTQYFTNRQTVTGYTAKYQGEFTERRSKIAAYDTELQELKTQIGTNNTSLDNQKAQLAAQEARMNSERSNGQNAQYNSEVTSYNQRVDTYNALVATTKNLINQYNEIVNARNAVVLEEQQLAQELSSSSVK